MKVCLTIPSFSIHGGIRVILEWANRLSKWHQVYLFCSAPPSACNWFDIDPKVSWINSADQLQYIDRLIICSPHHIHLRRLYPRVKKIIFMQMAEHLFRPNDLHWLNKCMRFYTAPEDLISISKWNIDMIRNEFGRTGAVHYVGNGVNLDHFPISYKPKDGKTILIEGWESSNPSKDPVHIGPKVAARLKNDGYKILAYSALPLKTFAFVPEEYYEKPSLEKINELYERATIMIKATRFDARSCAPMEAMTKATMTVRAIEKGDDDLLNYINSLRCGYSETDLYNYSLWAMQSEEGRSKIACNCIPHVFKYSWDYWMEKINEIICKD